MTAPEIAIVMGSASDLPVMQAAADAVADGQVIVLPTDTVYGVGADPFSAAAVQRLLDAKHRGRDMPPPVLVAEVEMIRALSVACCARACFATFVRSSATTK